MESPLCLVVDDNVTFAETLCRSLERRGWRACYATGYREALARAQALHPSHAVIDLMLGALAENGLVLLDELRGIVADMRIVLLTGYASAATAAEAIRRGATDYLAKPAGLEQLIAALQGQRAATIDQPASPLTLRQLEWEVLQRTLLDSRWNISAAARRLGMERRTLQRKLRKHAPKR